MNRQLRSCVICGAAAIQTHWLCERIVIVTCCACLGIVRIEFDPPDDPGVQGRIDVLSDPHEDESGGRRP